MTISTLIIYSLDDISDVEKREPDERGRKAGKDIERFEMLEPALLPWCKAREGSHCEISKAPAVQIEEPVRFDEPERAAKKAAPVIEPRDEAAGGACTEDCAGKAIPCGRGFTR
jgi:hypothetical protein